MTTTLQLVNQLLVRTGQATVTTLASLATPAQQALLYLNDVYAELLQTLPIYLHIKQSSIGVVTGINAYDLSSTTDLDQLLHSSIRLQNERSALVEVSAADSNALDTTTTGQPTHFWKQGTQLVFWPTPDASYTITYAYLPKPAELGQAGDSETIDFPASWQRVLLLGAQALLERFLGDSNTDQTFALYDRALGQLRRKARLNPRPALKNSRRGPRQPRSSR